MAESSVEAVIISGARRGEIVTLNDPQMTVAREPQLTPEEQHALETAVAEAKRFAENARAAAEEMASLRRAFDSLLESLATK